MSCDRYRHRFLSLLAQAANSLPPAARPTIRLGSTVLPWSAGALDSYFQGSSRGGADLAPAELEQEVRWLMDLFDQARLHRPSHQTSVPREQRMPKRSTLPGYAALARLIKDNPQLHKALLPAVAQHARRPPDDLDPDRDDEHAHRHAPARHAAPTPRPVGRARTCPYCHQPDGKTHVCVQMEPSVLQLRLSAGSQQTRLGAVRALQAHIHRQDVRATLLQRMRVERAWEVREAIVRVLHPTGDADVLYMLATHAQPREERAWQVRRAAAEMLVYWKHDEAGSALAQLMGDPVPAVRLAALGSLNGHLQDPAVDSTLRRMAYADPDMGVRTAAANMVAELDHPRSHEYETAADRAVRRCTSCGNFLGEAGRGHKPTCPLVAFDSLIARLGLPLDGGDLGTLFERTGFPHGDEEHHAALANTQALLRLLERQGIALPLAEPYDPFGAAPPPVSPAEAMAFSAVYEQISRAGLGRTDPRVTPMPGLIAMPDELAGACRALQAAGASRVLVVGGAVRDALMGERPKDIDLEVYGLEGDTVTRTLTIMHALEPCGRVSLVGASFGVIKLALRRADGTLQDVDVSLPRRDNKVGIGHKGFSVEADPTMSPVEAAARRDFTWNSMGWDPNTEELIDPFGGRADLEAGIIRHTSPAFAQDPLRVLRGMQFAARYGFRMAPETVELCRNLVHEADTLPVERVWLEWEKLARRGRYPGAGLRVLAETGWLRTVPELAALAPRPDAWGNPVPLVQDPVYHPEGDVFTHTCLVADRAAEIARRDQLDPEATMELVLASIAHDLGKAETTQIDCESDGKTVTVSGVQWQALAPEGRASARITRVRSPGHEPAGVEPTLAFLARIGAPVQVRERVARLTAEHLAHLNILQERAPRARASATRKLAKRLAPATIDAWGRLVEADHSGRDPLPHGNPAAPVVEMARVLAVADGAPRPILLGRHLLELGVTPGPRMGEVLRAAEAAQLNGVFTDLAGATRWAERWLATHAIVEDTGDWESPADAAGVAGVAEEVPA